MSTFYKINKNIKITIYNFENKLHNNKLSYIMRALQGRIIQMNI